MLAQVMEDQDDINRNSNNVRNSLQFNDDENNEYESIEPKLNHNFFGSHFNRRNKRLKTIINSPLNILNMPIMINNSFNYHNNFA